MRLRIFWAIFVSASILPFSPLTASAQTQWAPCPIPILRTHTLAPYPVAAAKNGEKGAVLIAVNIGADGVPVGVKTVKSSGFTDLDETAATWVKTQWRWEPPPKSCQSVRVSYNWNPHNADPATRALFEDHH